MSQWSNSQDCTSLADSDGDGESRGAAEPPKTVRCVILKEFDSGPKRFGCGDCSTPPPQQQPLRRENTQVVGDSGVDSVRLKNHLEWKKQKELEYVRKREAERAEEEKKKEEKLREEKEKRRREKEREEKIREWQEQKAREKEERKREEIVLKALEQEIKGVTQTLDKEKLIHEWIRLKNKQKQIEAEKKAELLKKEEETRALRQTLAEISYRQWKERTKNRRIVLPKNGYQIFGPKPVPVVKEDWNHDFTSDSADDKAAYSRTPKSTASMTSVRGSTVSKTDSASQFNNLRKRNPSSSQLKITRSKTSVNDFDAVPFKELGIPKMDSAQRWKSVENFISRQEEDSLARQSTVHLLRDEARAKPAIPYGFASKSKLFNVPVLPSKNKLDIYLNTSDCEPAPSVAADRPKKTMAEDNLKRYLDGLNAVNAKLLIGLSEKLSSNAIRGAGQRSPRNVRDGGAASRAESRRSRSYDKPIRKAQANRSSSVATSKKEEKCKKVESRGKAEAVEAKGRKKTKRATKPDPILLVDSPYCSRRPRGKTKAKE